MFAGEAYAEIEVRKMIMTLTVSENGCVYYLKRPGAVLSAGTNIAKLQLDDPDRVTVVCDLYDALSCGNHASAAQMVRRIIL